VTAVVRYHLRWVEQNPDWARYLFHMRRSDYLAVSEAGIKEQNRRFLERVGKWLRPHLEAGSIRELPLDLYASLVMGPCREFAREWLLHAPRTEMKDAIDTGGMSS